MANLVRAFDEVWRTKVIKAELRYRRRATPETRAEYLQVLRAFKEFVLSGKKPQD